MDEEKPKKTLVSATGAPLKPEVVPPTKRSAERLAEDDEYTPVIVKRTDESKIHPDDILERAVHEGEEQLNRHPLSLFLSAIAAGLILGFSAMAVAVVYSALGDSVQGLQRRILTAFVYPLGFVICIMSGTQLFTEHTATAVYPVLDRRKKISDMVRLWLIVIIGNLLGAATIAWFMTSAGEILAADKGFIEIAEHLTGQKFSSLLVSSVLAGWLMAQGGWLVLGSRVHQIVSIYIVTFLIGIGGFHHSIAGSVEMFTAMMISPEYGVGEAAFFIGTALLGNLIGGSVFVATLNFAYIREIWRRSGIDIRGS